MRRIFLALASLMFVTLFASAQSTWQTPLGPGGPTVTGGVAMCLNGQNQAIPCNSSTPQAVTVSGNSGTPTQTSVSVTAASTTVLAASTATSFLKLCVALSAANGVWVNWAGAAAVQAAPSEYVAPGQCDSWTKSTGFLPTSQINAVASSTVPVSLIYN